MKKVPLGISIINGILLAISAIMLATGLSGLLNLQDSPLNPFLRMMGTGFELPRPWIVGGIVSIVTSIIIFISAIGLGRAKTWAFFTVVSFFALSLIIEAPGAFSGSLLAILIVLGSLSCLAYLLGASSVRKFLKGKDTGEFAEELPF